MQLLGEHSNPLLILSFFFQSNKRDSITFVTPLRTLVTHLLAFVY
jgi:hypothetical protein